MMANLPGFCWFHVTEPLERWPLSDKFRNIAPLVFVPSARTASQDAHETRPTSRRRACRPDHLVRPGARVHRLCPGGSPQPADGPVWRLHHLHPDGAFRWSAGDDFRRRRLDGGGDRCAGGAARCAVLAGHGFAGRRGDDPVRLAAPGQAGAVGALPGDARLRQRPGDRHRHGPAGALQGGRALARRYTAVPDDRPGGADHGGGLRAAEVDPCGAASAGGDPRRWFAGVPARPAHTHPGRHGAHRRWPAAAGPAGRAVEPRYPEDHRPLRGADGHGRPAGNPAYAQPDR
ncbi:hypothetical protein D3C78_886500 [compost metagenome]